jgi:hypothetical protein
MDLINKFHKFEEKYALFNIKIDGVHIWEQLRVEIFREIELNGKKNHADSKKNKSIYKNIKALGSFSRNIFYRNPYFAQDSEIIFFGHQRRKKMPDGYWWDLYCDPIYENCNLDSVHFEMPHRLSHYSPAKTESLRYTDLIQYTGTIQRKLGLYNNIISSEKLSRLKEIEEGIEDTFNINIDLVGRVSRLLQNRQCRLWLYKFLLKRINPSVVVVVVSYGKHRIIEACKSMDIPVVELQHGIINPGHPGYSFPENHPKTIFPDYLLTWGEFWSDGVKFPISEDHVIPVGYPFIERSLSEYTSVQEQKQILFISSGTFGDELSKFALEIDQHPDIDHDITYKLHPYEYNLWKEAYPWLVEANFDVIDGSDPPLYELFSESSLQIGVYSTAIYEGLAFGLKTYIYDHPEAYLSRSLINNGDATLISTVDDLINSIGTQKNSFDREYYFKSDPSVSICNLLSDLIEEQE